VRNKTTLHGVYSYGDSPGFAPGSLLILPGQEPYQLQNNNRNLKGPQFVINAMLKTEK
jgi:hypothetical protein